MDNKMENVTIALAGTLQAITLISELTKTGKIEEQAFRSCIYSIFQIDAPDVPAVFGGTNGVRMGLENLITLFDKNPNNRILSRYLLSVIHLQKKLFCSPQLLKTLQHRIHQTQKQVDYFSLTHPTVIANLADSYLTAVNTFKFRMIMFGNQRILNVKENMDKIRALLLAGIRGATLWRQVGGSRLQLLFSRTQIKSAAEKLLAELEEQKESV